MESDKLDYGWPISHSPEFSHPGSDVPEISKRKKKNFLDFDKARPKSKSVLAPHMERT
jgi:hypothetical protein